MQELNRMGSEEELLQLAKEELLRDVKLASMRAQYVGAHAWAKPQKLVANKRFLRNMLFHSSRDERSSQRRESSSDKSEKPLHSENSTAEGDYKLHKFHRSKQEHDLKRSSEDKHSENKSRHNENKSKHSDHKSKHSEHRSKHNENKSKHNENKSKHGEHKSRHGENKSKHSEKKHSSNKKHKKHHSEKKAKR